MKNTTTLLLCAMLSLTSFFTGAQINRANSAKANRQDANYERLSSGAFAAHSFEIRQGTLWAWGRNTYGQLGDGTTTDRNSPVKIGNDDRWVSVSAGQNFTLALKSDGTLWSWGRNYYGQLGDGTTIQKNAPIQVGTDNDWVSISAGIEYAHAIKSNGTLWAWGSNYSNALGDGTSIDRTLPVQIGTNNDWVRVSDGEYHSVGLKSNGTLWAWGNNQYGQLGNGNTVSLAVPTQIGTDNKWTHVQAGSNCAIGLKVNGTLWAWGWNGNSQLGIGNVPSANTPTQIGLSQQWVEFSLGSVFCLALQTDGTLWGWGWNGVGSIGNGSTVNEQNPVLVDTGWVHIAASQLHAIGIREDGSAHAWGQNSAGELGIGNNINQLSPVLTSTDRLEWVRTTSGRNHTLSLQSNGTLWAWGMNDSGQLGDGTSTLYREAPVLVGSARPWIQASGGAGHSLGIKADGTLWGWGLNNNGQVGNGTNIGESIPAQIGTDNDWVSVFAGKFNTSFAIKSNGTLWAWGSNNQGQLGNGTTIDQLNPVQIGTDNKWVRIAASSGSTLGLKSDGTLWAWGGNGFGQLGDGTTTDQLSPIQIGSASDWTSIAAGLFSSYALKSNGTLWSWGGNANGQLGNGGSGQINAPAQIAPSANWIAVEAGFNHAFAIADDGTLSAFGRNADGQLGDGTNNNQSSPVQIGVENEWTAITAGDKFSVGLKAQKNQFCSTGSDTYGELGNGNDGPVNTFSCVCLLPPAPLDVTPTNNLTVCEGGSTTLSVAGGVGTISWYDAQGGGNYLGSGLNFTTPNLSTTTTFYAQDSTCGPVFTAITVTVNSIDADVTNSMGIFTVNQAGATYQWVSCPSMTPIPGATNQSFTPTANGEYAVLVELNNCSETSACVSINDVGLAEESEVWVNVFPNPTNGKVQLTSATPINEISVLDNSGREVFKQKVQPSNATMLDLSTLNSGVLYLKIRLEDESETMHTLILNAH